MNIKGIVYEDFVNYKKPSMFIAFPSCTFKCEKESGVRCCQNSALAKQENIEVSPRDLVQKYIQNPITHAIVIGGLEPLDSLYELEKLIQTIRDETDDDIVIYTGYTEEEAKIPLTLIGVYRYNNIIIKFGRYVPNTKPHFDSLLGVNLMGDGQYAKSADEIWGTHE